MKQGPTGFEVHLIPLGKSGVGKTALVQRYLQQKFEETSKTIRTTQHSTIVKIGHEQLNVNIWDVGGKVKKKTTDKCNVYFLCFNVVDDPSFKFIKKLYQQLKSQHNENNYFCLVGCKGDLRQNDNCTPVPLESITQFADEIGVHYQETSAKDNTGISTVFNNAFQKKREVLIIEQQKMKDQQCLEEYLNTKVNISQIFEISRIRVLYVENVGLNERIAVQHATMEENVDKLLDYFLMGDIDPKNSPLFECAARILRTQTELLKQAIINSPRILHKLMTLLTTPEYSKLTDRTRSIFIDFLQGLTKSHLNSLIQFLNRFPLEYQKDDRNNVFVVNGVVPEGELVFVRHLMMECADEGKLKLVTEILNADQKMGVETGTPTLIQRLHLGNTLLMILNVPSGISTVDGIFKQVVKTYGTSSQLVLETITFDDYRIPKFVLEAICKPDTSDEAVAFCTQLLTVHQDNRSQLLKLHSILVYYSSEKFAQLLTSSSLRLRHSALQLTEQLVKLRCHDIARPLLPSCLDLFFSETRGNVIHHLVTSIVTEIVRSGDSAIQQYVLVELRFPERIKKAFEEPDEEDSAQQAPNVSHLVSPRKSKEYFGHLAQMVKAIEEAQLGTFLQDSLLATEQWKIFKAKVLHERSERELFPPSSEMRLKNRQGSVIVLTKKPLGQNGAK